jgi:hypothetical protein
VCILSSVSALGAGGSQLNLVDEKEGTLSKRLRVLT